ncbi:MAG: hypothetical protein HYS08_01955, partial [Chlamydiae bacterium]|nr:hypothetical protein [Chlamydiota bacterium]
MDTGWAQERMMDVGSSKLEGKAERTVVPSNIQPLSSNVNVSTKLGDILERHQGSSDKLIIHIQDVHCHFEAQSNSAKIMNELMKEHEAHGLKMIGLEAAGGEVDTSKFTAFPDPAIRKMLAEYLMKEGKISGAEYLSIVKNKPLPLQGIENMKEYFTHLVQFDRGQELKSKAEPILQGIEKRIEGLKEEIYSKEVKEILKENERYASGKIELGDYVEYLISCFANRTSNIEHRTSNQTESEVRSPKYDVRVTHPNIDLMLQMSEIEKNLDLKAVEEERIKVIEELSKSLVKEEVIELMTKSLYYRLEKMDAWEYYEYLKKLIERNTEGQRSRVKDQENRDQSNSPLKVRGDGGVMKDKGSYINLTQYIQMTELYHQIDSNVLMKECEELSQSVLDQTLKSPEEKGLHKIEEDFALLKNLIEIELKKSQYKIYLENKERVTFKSIVERINEIAVQESKGINSPRSPLKIRGEEKQETEEYSPLKMRGAGGVNILAKTQDTITYLDQHLKDTEAFYEYSDTREKSLVENTLTKMEEEKSPIAILYTGGFHTDGMMERLKKEGASYVVIAPRITEFKLKTPYLSIIKNEPNELEKAIKGIQKKEGSNLAPLKHGVDINALRGLMERLPLNDPRKETIQRVIDADKTLDLMAIFFVELLYVAQLWEAQTPEIHLQEIYDSMMEKWKGLIGDVFEKQIGKKVIFNIQGASRSKNGAFYIPIRIEGGEGLYLKLTQETKFDDVKEYPEKYLVTGLPHSAANDYIQRHLPEDLRKNKDEIKNYPQHSYLNPTTIGKTVQARVIPIPGLFEATGQLGHIGLGQVYGEPVIYVDADYDPRKAKTEGEDAETVLNHEAYEITGWESKSIELGKTPSQMRMWIQDSNHFEEAKAYAKKLHESAPSVDEIIKKRRGSLQGCIEQHLAMAQEIYEDEEGDINLEAGMDEKNGVLFLQGEESERVLQTEDQWIPLDGLIGYLRQVTGETGGRDYGEWFDHPESLAQAVQSFGGEPARVGPLIHQQSDYENQAAVELVANGIDAMLALAQGKFPIGRFGVGAFQVLQELEHEDDEVVWTSSRDGITAWRVTVKLKDNRYVVRFSKVTQGVSQGTKVQVHHQLYAKKQQKDLKDYLEEKLRYNNKVKIMVNGVHINSLEGLTYQNGGSLNYEMAGQINILIDEHGYIVTDDGTGMDAEAIYTKLLLPRVGQGYRGKPDGESSADHTRLFYRQSEKSPREKTKVRVGILVSGVQIEGFEIEGYNLPQDFVLELPYWTHLTEGRNKISLDELTLEALEITLDKIFHAPSNLQPQLVNAYALLLKHFAEDSARRDLVEELKIIFIQKIGNWKKAQPNKICLPNEEGFMAVQLPEHYEANYLDTWANPLRPQEIVGVQKVKEWRSNRGYSLWTIPMADAKDPYFISGKYIFVDESLYRTQEDVPAAIDLVVNPVDVDYGIPEEPYGSLEPAEESIKIKTLAEKTKSEVMAPDLQEKWDALLGLSSSQKREVREFIRHYGPENHEAVMKWLERLQSFSNLDGWTEVFSKILPGNMRMDSKKREGQGFYFIGTPFQMGEKWCVVVCQKKEEPRKLAEINPANGYITVPKGATGFYNIRTPFRAGENWFVTVEREKDGPQSFAKVDLATGLVELSRGANGFLSIGKPVQIGQKWFVITGGQHGYIASLARFDPETGIVKVPDGANSFNGMSEPFQMGNQWFVNVTIVNLQSLHAIARIDEERGIVAVPDELGNFDIVETPFEIGNKWHVIVKKEGFYTLAKVDPGSGQITVPEDANGYYYVNGPIRIGKNWFVQVQKEKDGPHTLAKIDFRDGSIILPKRETTNFRYIDSPFQIGEKWFVGVGGHPSNLGSAFASVDPETGEISLPSSWVEAIDHFGSILDQKTCIQIGEKWYAKVGEGVRGPWTLAEVDPNTGRITIPGHAQWFSIIRVPFQLGTKWVVEVSEKLTDPHAFAEVDPENGLMRIPYGARYLKSINGPFSLVEKQYLHAKENSYDDSEFMISISATPFRQGEWGELEFSTVEKSLRELYILFHDVPGSRERYLENLFYLPARFSDLFESDFFHRLLALFPTDLLQHLSPKTAGVLTGVLKTMTTSRVQGSFLSFFDRVDLGSLNETALEAVIHRWVSIWNIVGSNVNARNSLLEGLERYPDFLSSEFDVQGVQDLSLMLYMWILRGEEEGMGEKKSPHLTRRDITRSITDIPLAKIIQAYRENPSGVRGIQSLADYEQYLQAVQKKKTDAVESEIASAQEGQDTTDQLYLRENVQNARDAMDEKEIEGPVEVDSYIEKGTENWVVSVEDKAGTDIGTFLSDFFVPDLTTKKGKGLAGIMGQGVYTNFLDFDELRIKTGTGKNGKAYYAVLHRDRSGKIILKSLEEVNDSYQGTRIERVKRQWNIEESAVWNALTASNLRRYVGGVSDREILFRGNRMNDPLTVLSEVKTKWGTLSIKLSKAGYRRVTQKGLYLQTPNEEYLALVPEKYKKMLLERGLNIDLPPELSLTRSRTTLAKKGKNKKAIQQAVAKGVLEAIVRLYLEEGVIPPGLSEDYFDSPVIHGGGLTNFERYAREAVGTFGEGKEVKGDANFINQGKWAQVKFEKYLIQEKDSDELKEKKSRSLAYLMSLIEVEQGGETTSLEKMRQTFLNAMRGKQSVESLKSKHRGLEKYLKQSEELVNRKVAAIDTPRRDIDLKKEEPYPGVRKFVELTQIGLQALGRSDIQVGVYEREESRLADFGDHLLMWNLLRIKTELAALNNILSGEASAIEKNKFFRWFLHYLTHELSHFADQGKASHQKDDSLVGLLAWNQKELLKKFLNAKLSWDEIERRLNSGDTVFNSATSEAGMAPLMSLVLNWFGIPREKQAGYEQVGYLAAFIIIVASIVASTPLLMQGFLGMMGVAGIFILIHPLSYFVIRIFEKLLGCQLMPQGPPLKGMVLGAMKVALANTLSLIPAYLLYMNSHPALAIVALLFYIPASRYHHEMNLGFLKKARLENYDATAASLFSTMASLFSRTLNSSKLTLPFRSFLINLTSDSMRLLLSSSLAILASMRKLLSSSLAILPSILVNLSLVSYRKLSRLLERASNLFSDFSDSSSTLLRRATTFSPTALNWLRISSIRTALYRWISSVGRGFGDFFSFMKGILHPESNRVNWNNGSADVVTPLPKRTPSAMKEYSGEDKDVAAFHERYKTEAGSIGGEQLERIRTNVIRAWGDLSREGLKALRELGLTRDGVIEQFRRIDNRTEIKIGKANYAVNIHWREGPYELKGV